MKGPTEKEILLGILVVWIIAVIVTALNNVKNSKYIDTSKITNETLIHFSKTNSYYLFTLITFPLLIAGIITLIMTQYIWGSIFTIIGAYTTLIAYKKLKNNEPQIIINTKGIATKTTEFKEWSEIRNETIKGIGSKHRHYYLIYDYSGGSEKMAIGDLEISIRDLEILLEVYRNRSRK